MKINLYLSLTLKLLFFIQINLFFLFYIFRLLLLYVLIPWLLFYTVINNKNQNQISQKFGQKLMSAHSSLVDKSQLFNLIFGIAGIYASYITAGVLNERIIKKPYFSPDTLDQPEYFNSTLVFIFFTTGIPWLIGSIINNFTIKPHERTQIPIKNSMSCALIILISTFSYISSIFYASFPIATLFKSCNLLSVVLVGVCCSRVKEKSLKLERKKFLIASLITIGLIVFKLTDPQAMKKDKNSTQMIGISLLLVSLIADGFLPDFQAEVKIKYKPKPMEMMVENNKWVCIFSFALICISYELPQMTDFCVDHPDFFGQILFMGLLATTGQMFIYRMIKQFKQHIVPFVVTTRKISTSSLSLIFYRHETSLGQVFSILLIFSIVFYEFFNQIKAKKSVDQEVKVCQVKQTIELPQDSPKKQNKNNNNNENETCIEMNYMKDKI